MAQIFIEDCIFVLARDGPGRPPNTSHSGVRNIEARNDGAWNWVLVEKMFCKIEIYSNLI